MPQVLEQTVATGRGVRAERDLAQAAADFYVLELLTARGDVSAAKMLTEHEACLAREFACYLDMAVGGELRYAMQHLGKEALPAELACFVREIDSGERGMAWMAWTVVRRVLGLRALEHAAVVFGTSGWAENFGGQAWATVARLLRDRLRGRVVARVFVDQCFSLEHNTGSVSTSSRPRPWPGSWRLNTGTTTGRCFGTPLMPFAGVGGSASGDDARNMTLSGSGSRRRTRTTSSSGR